MILFIGLYPKFQREKWVKYSNKREKKLPNKKSSFLLSSLSLLFNLFQNEVFSSFQIELVRTFEENTYRKNIQSIIMNSQVLSVCVHVFTFSFGMANARLVRISEVLSLKYNSILFTFCIFEATTNIKVMKQTFASFETITNSHLQTLSYNFSFSQVKIVIFFLGEITCVCVCL